ncbi:preprotein translocase subunit SecE [Candidatus Woesebacteria bacterium RIFOXYA1_FULL_43_9]|uniref:Protein translocase subunit SecE n=1 Tax=Candidatus Woesebacteria bacterium RIFOXYA1_FULL_43_9 TaxID=1802534 RepID=A0A1F8CNA0_9BACT|nr:MAG: preprotein translocase subunit SecE [Candidatus Woesebacteria bacterium RIFOXYA1_FULL_43_9]
MSKIRQFLSEVRGELAKIVWPKRETVIRLTLIVITFSAIVGGFLGGLDLVFTNLIKIVLTK